MALSTGALRNTLSSAQTTDFQGSSGLPDVPGTSVSLAATSPPYSSDNT